MNTDYWDKFTQTGSVLDYLNYRNSILEKDKHNGKSEYKSYGDSNKRDKNQGK